MTASITEVVRVDEAAPGIFSLTFRSGDIAAGTRAGQFVNLRVGDLADPLLRRPFSVYETEGDTVSVLFNIVGKGTEILSRLRRGDRLDVLGPLGTPFGFERNEYQTGILVGGGLGVAPLPLLYRAIRSTGRNAIVLLGARTASQLVPAHLGTVRVATDDGSTGYHGTVVGLLDSVLEQTEAKGTRIFGCGPTPMLRALQEMAIRKGIACEVSLEGPMGCGFGICQGCPVELVGQERKYALMCKDGPVFDCRTVRL
jgi:dihydroorotate dehydrogenase electron transfer subunit